jgi:small-conductance mechanosensitive channel
MRKERKTRKDLRDLKLERMFETRSDEWERVGLAVQHSERAVKRAQREVVVLLPMLVGVLVAWSHRVQILGLHAKHPDQTPHTPTAITIGVAVVLVVLGWALARALGKMAGPTFLRRMDPGTAGTVGFLFRLATIVIALLEALRIVGVKPQTLAVGGAFSAVVIGLAAQQTLGNLIAGMVLLSARPFKVGERVRLQAGALGGTLDGIVSSLGLLYTTLARGDDRIMIPNTQVLSAVVVPVREPDRIDVKVRVGSGIRPSRAQEMLDQSITTPTRSPPRVLLEEIDGPEVVLRIQATPESADGGAKLADEIIAALASVTEEHTATGHHPATDHGSTGDPRSPADDQPTRGATSRS